MLVEPIFTDMQNGQKWNITRYRHNTDKTL